MQMDLYIDLLLLGVFSSGIVKLFDEGEGREIAVGMYTRMRPWKITQNFNMSI